MVTSNPTLEKGHGATSWDAGMLLGMNERSKGRQLGTSGMTLTGSMCIVEDGMMTWAVQRRCSKVRSKPSQMRL
jgi:hypothetical protein